jgi:hypothetical protein
MNYIEEIGCGLIETQLGYLPGEPEEYHESFSE